MKLRQARKIIKMYRSNKANYWNVYNTDLILSLIAQLENQRLLRALRIVCKFTEPPKPLKPTKKIKIWKYSTTTVSCSSELT